MFTLPVGNFKQRYIKTTVQHGSATTPQFGTDGYYAFSIQINPSSSFIFFGGMGVSFGSPQYRSAMTTISYFETDGFYIQRGNGSIQQSLVKASVAEFFPGFFSDTVQIGSVTMAIGFVSGAGYITDVVSGRSFLMPVGEYSTNANTTLPGVVLGTLALTADNTVTATRVRTTPT